MCVLRKDVGAAAHTSFDTTHIWLRRRMVNRSETQRAPIVRAEFDADAGATLTRLPA